MRIFTTGNWSELTTKPLSKSPWIDIVQREGGQRACPCRLGPDCGVTLIEISVVLFLIGILLFISIPKLGGFLFQADLNGAVRSLRAAVNVLRSKSISSNKATSLHLDLDRNMYWGAYALPDGQMEEDASQGMLFTPKRLPEGIRFLDAGNITTPKRTYGTLRSSFNSRGALEETVIHLKDKNENVVTVLVNAYTGRFSIFDEYVDVEYQ